MFVVEEFYCSSVTAIEISQAGMEQWNETTTFTHFSDIFRVKEVAVFKIQQIFWRHFRTFISDVFL